MSKRIFSWIFLLTFLPVSSGNTLKFDPCINPVSPHACCETKAFKANQNNHPAGIINDVKPNTSCLFHSGVCMVPKMNPEECNPLKVDLLNQIHQLEIDMSHAITIDPYFYAYSPILAYLDFVHNKYYKPPLTRHNILAIVQSFLF